MVMTRSRYKKKKDEQLPEQKTHISDEKKTRIESINDLIDICNNMIRNFNFESLNNDTYTHPHLNPYTLLKIKPYLENLSMMIGMKDLKETIFQQVVYYLQGLHLRNTDGEYLHTVIYGKPGHGKTEVAQIIANLYVELGVVPKRKFVIATRDDFVAEYMGQTAIKTRKLLEHCKGGVLFIDEVYALGTDVDSKDSYSKEAIDILNAFLSENKHDFCCIIAGYKEDVNRFFFSLNKGLLRRFPWTHEIPEYTVSELVSIFRKIAFDSNWKISKHIKTDKLEKIFHKNKKLFVFAGGDVEVFFTKCKISHSIRLLNNSKDTKFILTWDDILKGMELTKKHKNQDKEETNDSFNSMFL